MKRWRRWIAAVCAIIGAMFLICGWKLSNSHYVSGSQFAKIKTGMIRNDVEAILGQPFFRAPKGVTALTNTSLMLSSSKLPDMWDGFEGQVQVYYDDSDRVAQTFYYKPGIINVWSERIQKRLEGNRDPKPFWE